MADGSKIDWRAWVAELPETAFPLTADGVLLWLRQNGRVPPLFWDQFRTCFLSRLAGTEWEAREAMLRDMEAVEWG
jgi:hypothetical protein